MRPLPRLLAFTNDQLADRDDFPIKVAAALSVGAGLGVVVRAPGRAPGDYRRLLDRVKAMARTTEATVFAHGDASLGALPGVAGAVVPSTGWPIVSPRAGWYGAELGPGQPAPPNARFLVAGPPGGSEEEAGPIADWQRRLLADPRPVFLWGSTGLDRCHTARAAGAYGLAATEAVFGAADTARAAAELLARWHQA